MYTVTFIYKDTPVLTYTHIYLIKCDQKPVQEWAQNKMNYQDKTINKY